MAGLELVEQTERGRVGPRVGDEPDAVLHESRTEGRYEIDDPLREEAAVLAQRPGEHARPRRGQIGVVDGERRIEPTVQGGVRRRRPSSTSHHLGGAGGGGVVTWCQHQSLTILSFLTI